MPLITEQISNLINGVSQQPPSLRLASQCETQENGLVTIAEGLKKRPPLEFVAKLSIKLTLMLTYISLIEMKMSDILSVSLQTNSVPISAVIFQDLKWRYGI